MFSITKCKKKHNYNKQVTRNSVLINYVRIERIEDRYSSYTPFNILCDFFSLSYKVKGVNKNLIEYPIQPKHHRSYFFGFDVLYKQKGH